MSEQIVLRCEDSLEGIFTALFDALYEGMEDEVLLETALSETLFTGYTRLYVPVVVSAPGRKSGEIVRVRLGSYDGERVRAALC